MQQTVIQESSSSH